jgi:hypothetical protein
MHDIVILAGGKADPETKEKAGVNFRSELPWQGTTLVDHVYSVAREFGEPLVVGGPHRDGWRQATGGDSFVESFTIGASLVTTPSFLLITADLPFLTAESIQYFVSNSDPDAGWNYPIIPLEICKQEFPDLKRTTMKVREGEFTGGNLCLIDQQAFQIARPIIQKAYDARKSPIQLGRIAGFQTLALIAATKVLPKFTTLPALQRAVGGFLKSPTNAVITPFAGIGTDIDSYEQYQAIMRGSDS